MGGGATQGKGLDRDLAWLARLITNKHDEKFFGTVELKFEAGTITCARIQEVVKPPK